MRYGERTKNTAGPRGETVLLVTFGPDGNPWEAFVARYAENGEGLTRYQFEHCRRDDQHYYHWSAGEGWRGQTLESCGGRDCTVWAAAGVAVTGNARVRVRLPRRWSLRALFTEAWEEETIYCTECNDWLPKDRPCDHLHFCEECSDWYYTDRAHPAHTYAFGSAAPDFSAAPV